MSFGLLGILSVMLCPMIFGGVAFYYSHKEIDKETRNRWKSYEEKK